MNRELEERCRKTARELVEESIVLLKNEDGILPLKESTRVAVFGRAQQDTVFSGNGSGSSHYDGGLSILDGLMRNGIICEPHLAEYYCTLVKDGVGCQPPFDWSKAGPYVNSGEIYEIFGQYHAPSQEYEITEEQYEKARKFTDTAILVIGRCAGSEECDRHLYEDYYLTESEKQLVSGITGHFEKVILILNVNGVIDLSWTVDNRSVKAILFAGVFGEQGAMALADIMAGKVSPSGRLAFTFAKRYEDYPSAEYFSWNKENDSEIADYGTYGLSAEKNGSVGFNKSPVTLYWEDIYPGYRYFDAMDIEPVYGFGEGLSYTGFRVELEEKEIKTAGIQLKLRVTNVGSRAGKNTVMVFCSGKVSEPWPNRKLAGFEKTSLLKPGENEILTVTVPWDELATYCEQPAAYKILKGEYLIQYGSTLRDLEKGFVVKNPEEIVYQQCSNCCVIAEDNRNKLNFFSPAISEENLGDLPFITIEKEEVPVKSEHVNKNKYLLDDFTDEQLMCLCVGYGPGVPFSAYLEKKFANTLLDENVNEMTVNDHPTGHNGYVSPAIPEKDIHSIFYKDGPAGIGMTAWPTEMLISCSFNRKLWQQFGECLAEECKEQRVDVILAPAVNLQRNPLGGRNFEYFSEDPYLTSEAGLYVALGVQNNGVLVCPKHFAANEQETYRRGNGKKNIDAVDSIMTERCLREIYLKPFQTLVEQGDIKSLMTSFNKINGVFTAGSHDLCTKILRSEWGFDGSVVTDWGDMDTVVDGADAVRAGNDIVMPGGPPVIEQIRKGMMNETLSRKDLVTAVNNFMSTLNYFKEFNRKEDPDYGK